MRKLFVFVGPSLSRADREKYPQINFLPPVEEGDVLKICKSEPDAIGILDGYFGDRRSVSHKEILWAMSQGIRVFGAASMGALRAAELDTYGMVGVGEIFEGYRSSEILDDGDVAIQHGPEELGFRSVTVAMVDVRATLRGLLARQRISRSECNTIENAAEKIHFSERTWTAVCAKCREMQVERDNLEHQLQSSHVERKRLDALELLERISNTSDQSQSFASFMPPMTFSFRQDLFRAGLLDGES